MNRFGYRITRCELCQQTVMLDTTWQDCAAAHCCGINECPHRDRFIGEWLAVVGGHDDAADEDAPE